MAAEDAGTSSRSGRKGLTSMRFSKFCRGRLEVQARTYAEVIRHRLAGHGPDSRAPRTKGDRGYGILRAVYLPACITHDPSLPPPSPKRLLELSSSSTGPFRKPIDCTVKSRASSMAPGACRIVTVFHTNALILGHTADRSKPSHSSSLHLPS
jgi:hypothetical protein